MGADISLDETFESGVDGCPGTRFILRLNQPAIEIEHASPQHRRGDSAMDIPRGDEPEQEKDSLPESLSILIVDDDTMIRKMFKRAAMRVVPTWTVDEVCNGETALCITETQTFDVIFVDQYMASVEKQLLGTETTRALRSRGVKSIICGLSANDMAVSFLESGADTFMLKPFPCKKEAMHEAFIEVLGSREANAAEAASSVEMTA